MEHTLKLGEGVIVGRGLFTKRRIAFAGESSPGVFSLVLEWTEVHNSAAYNLYFQKSQREFSVFDGRVAIINVTKHELRFRFAKGAGRDGSASLEGTL